MIHSSLSVLSPSKRRQNCVTLWNCWGNIPAKKKITTLKVFLHKYACGQSNKCTRSVLHASWSKIRYPLLSRSSFQPKSRTLQCTLRRWIFHLKHRKDAFEKMQNIFCSFDCCGKVVAVGLVQNIKLYFVHPFTLNPASSSTTDSARFV